MAELDIRQFSAIAYDFDGTLKDSVGDHERARQGAFDAMVAAGDERFGMIDQAVFDEAHRHGSNPTAIIGWVLRESGIVISEDPASDLLTMTVVRLKRELYRDVCVTGGTPIDGALDFVRRMSVVRPGGEYMVTTAERQAEVVPFLIRQKLTRHFPDVRIVAHEDVDRLKPDPEAYEQMLERAGLTRCPERVLAIEDSAQGIRASKQAGIPTVALTTTHTAEEVLPSDRALHPDFVVSGFAELGELLLP
ncbi:HAD family phosphatase [Candidatus Saccharibacteria bacterium]|nr:HAD family phosphatase [Candidatus Saccharibacteria bacterium]